MAGLLDKIIVIDIECTCWEKNPPSGQESEIIEIGVCLLDTRSGERSAKDTYLIKPTRSQVSPFCTQLTTLTADMLAGGMSFERALLQMKRKYRTKDRAWASFGDYDRKRFIAQCADFGLSYPFSPTHFNIKTLFSLAHQLLYEVGLEVAMKTLDLPMEGTHHRGVDDAWNAAAVLRELLKRLQSPPPP